MKKFFFVLVIGLMNFQLNALTVYIHNENHYNYPFLHPIHRYIVHDGLYYGYYGGAYGIHTGWGPNTGRTINEDYVVPMIRGLRSETFLNNSGSGANGPGTY